MSTKPVRPSASRYTFAAARRLYARRAHPRVALGADDLDTLRERVGRGDGLKIMTALRRKVRVLVDEAAAAAPDVIFEGNRQHNSLAARLAYAIDDIALVAALDRDPSVLDLVRRLMAGVSEPGHKGWPMGPATMGIAYDLLHEHLDAPLRQAFCAAGVTDLRRRIDANAADYLKHAAHNITLGSTLACVPLVLAISGEPGVPDLGDETALLLKFLEASINTAIHRQGYPEEDIGYGTSVAAALTQKAEWVRRAGLFDAYRACPGFSRFGDAMLHFVQPWGEDISNTGDHGDDFGQREFVLARLAAETREPALLWLLGQLTYSHGRIHPENTLPEFHVEVPLRPGFQTPASWRSLLVLDELKGEVHPVRRRIPAAFHEPVRGIATFRSGWTPDAAFVVFDGSQRSSSGQGHAHASCGHFSLSAVGEYFSIDTGRYNMEQNAHSVVLVDGKSGRSTDGEWGAVKHPGVMTACAPGELVDYAAVDSSHQHDCYWARRHLGLVKGRGVRPYLWVIDDINKCDGWGEYWWQLQSCPENAIAVRDGAATIRGWRNGNLLDVHFVVPAARDYPKPHTLRVEQDRAYTSSYKYCAPRDATPEQVAAHLEAQVARYPRPSAGVHGPVYVRPRLLAKVGGYNGRILSVMLPRLKGERAPRVRSLACIQNALAVRMTFADVEDRFVFAFDHGMLEADGVCERGEWCVIRRSLKTGRILMKHVARKE